ncbi:MAG: HAD-IIB family hydrolase [Muribaculaceae bacterium]|nr:HAD-IIB family hydrolase [Muribaculaceae bacterium]
MKTLYVSDMDGTLMGADSRVSAESAALLNRLIDERGMLFTVATARTPATVVPLMHDVHARLPFIVLSGAAMWSAAQGRFQHVQAIPGEVVDAVADIFEQHHLHPFIYRNHGGNMIYTHHYGPMTAPEEHFVEQRLNLPLKRFLLNDAHYRHSPDEAMLIYSMNDYAVLEPVYRQLQASTVPCTALLYRDNTDPSVALMEVYRQGCTKAAAIARLADAIGAERIVAFGDNLNDIAMLQAAHQAIAVENAVPEVKAIAHRIIGPNTAHSVARYLATIVTASRNQN